MDDANGDHRCDGLDLSILFAAMNPAAPPPNPPGTGADFNSDGVVNGLDLSILLGSFGVACAFNEASCDYRSRMVEFRTRADPAAAAATHRSRMPAGTKPASSSGR